MVEPRKLVATDTGEPLTSRTSQRMFFINYLLHDNRGGTALGREFVSLLPLDYGLFLRFLSRISSHFKSFYRRQFLSAPSCLSTMFVRALSNHRRHFSLGVFGLEEAPFTPS
jgi:hypothetical protein